MAKSIHKPPEFQTVCNRQSASAYRIQKRFKLCWYFGLMSTAKSVQFRYLASVADYETVI
jgi:hypothetical protein